jgi:hypothetical protein
MYNNKPPISTDVAAPSSSDTENSTSIGGPSSSSKDNEKPATQGPFLVQALATAQLSSDPYQDKVARQCFFVKASRYSRVKFSFYAFPNKEQAQKKELAWQKSVQLRFFKIGQPLCVKGKAQAIYQLVLEQIKGKNNGPLILDRQCRRSFIIALAKIFSQYKKLPKLSFKLGATIINFISDNDEGMTVKQKGNFKMEIPALGKNQIADEGSCMKCLDSLLEVGYEKEEMRRNNLLMLLKGRLKKFRSFVYKDFNDKGQIALLDENIADIEDKNVQIKIHFLNGLIFSITTGAVLAQLQGNSANDAFPVALVLVRSILLLLMKKITLGQFFFLVMGDGYGGVLHGESSESVTSSNTAIQADTMLEKLFAINAVYNKDLVINRLKCSNLCDMYLKSNESGYLAVGRRFMHLDLSRVYGSGDESDSDVAGYSSDEDEDLAVVPFKVHKQ